LQPLLPVIIIVMLGLHHGCARRGQAGNTASLRGGSTHWLQLLATSSTMDSTRGVRPAGIVRGAKGNALIGG